MATLFTNIKQLVGTHEDNRVLRGRDLSVLPCIDNAFLVIDGEHISRFGTMDEFTYNPNNFSEVVDASGRYVLPSWCDSHTHLVYAGSRETEFVDKIKGLS